MMHSALLQLLFEDFITLVLITVVVSLIFIDIWKKHWRNQLPGPINVPFLGYIPFLFSKKPHELLSKLRHKYGSICGFYVGERYMVVLNDIKAIRETVNRDEFLSRPFIHPINLFNKNSMFPSSGPIWKQEKRLALRIFHELGFGRRVMEQRVKDEIEDFMRSIEKHEGTSFNMRPFLYKSVNNNVSSLIFGRRFDYDDPATRSMISFVEQFEHTNSITDVATFFPYLQPIVRSIGKDLISQCLRYSGAVEDIIRREIDKERKQIEDETIRSYLHGYLLQMEKDKENTTLTEEALLGTAKVHYIAGLSTSVNTLEWLLLALISNPEVQHRVQREIDEVISRKGSIDWNEQKTMPYTRAVILETMRWRTLVPLAVPRCALEETTVQGCIVPRNTIVLTNIWAAHNDPSFWDSPKEFKPERFLDKEGKVINSDYCIPFSVGRRSCPGENLAQMEIFLYCVSILNKYHVSLPKDNVLKLDGIPRFTLVPKSFNILLTARS